jgi:hypothetical protein
LHFAAAYPLKIKLRPLATLIQRRFKLVTLFLSLQPCKQLADSDMNLVLKAHPELVAHRESSRRESHEFTVKTVQCVSGFPSSCPETACLFKVIIKLSCP